MIWILIISLSQVLILLYTFSSPSYGFRPLFGDRIFYHSLRIERSFTSVTGLTQQNPVRLYIIILKLYKY